MLVDTPTQQLAWVLLGRGSAAPPGSCSRETDTPGGRQGTAADSRGWPWKVSPNDVSLGAGFHQRRDVSLGTRKW